MKICVSDIDGTIVNSLGGLSKYTIDTLIDFQEKDNILILASGRSYLRMMPIAKQLKMDIFNGYLVDVNGLSIYNFKNNERKIIQRMDMTEIKDIFNFIKTFDAEIKFYCDDAIYTYLSDNIYNLKVKIRSEMKLPEDYPWTSGEYSWLADPRDGYPIQKLISDISEIEHEINKIAICHDHETLIAIQEKIINSERFNEYNIQFSGQRQVDITSKNISKGKAVQYILEQIKPDNTNVYIFGDNENDFSMLNLSENSYIMENSKLNNKDNKYDIAPSNDDDGVAKIINGL